MHFIDLLLHIGLCAHMTRLITKQLLELEDQKHKCRQAMVIMEQLLHDYQLELNSLHVRSTALRASLSSTREKHHYLALQTATREMAPPYEQEQLSIEFADKTAYDMSLPHDNTACDGTPAEVVSPARSVESLDTNSTSPPVNPPGTHVLVCGRSAAKLRLYGIGKRDTKIGPIPIRSGNGVSYRLGFPPGMFLDVDNFPAGDLEVTDQKLTVISGCPPLEGRVLDEIDRIDAAFLVHGGVYLLFKNCSWGTTYTKEVLDFLPSGMEVVDLRN
ncbi:Hypothetical protein conserved in the Yarrowia clade [Yarrowia lipolytica]|uniref:Uncharacterized protein n=1 Tax=Yarrowia lipolytica TaxID=4952 RepID=A0A371CC31_YARLL|nr:hypothetical protein B0I71DRAFT_12790 [Yarrowia lipolytica]VBB83053.1 Hypothetical protein conserved in the Yarrowia clade [Yarrowia lipolytica]